MYYIEENQFRDDGTINHISEQRQTINSGMSFFWERCSKMAMTQLFTKVVVAIYDEELNEVDRKIVDTMYPQPTVEEIAE